jgi:hypothetical protein
VRLPLSARPRRGLGQYPGVTLAAARQKATDARRAAAAELAALAGPDSYYGAFGFEDGCARLVKFAPDGAKVLRPHRVSDRLDLTHISRVTLNQKESMP